MRIAIHHREGGFSDRWISYCKNAGISFKIVNAFDSGIIEQIRDCEAFMWHHHHGIFKDVLAAKKILFALEHAGVTVFPDFYTNWHFDDKVAQKYLLEALNAPIVPSYVFYDKQIAIDWAESTTYPKVFKLKGGAGSANVKLVKHKKKAIYLIRKAFGKGFSQFDRFAYLKDRFNKYREGNDSIIGIMKGVGRLFIPTDFSKQHGREKGYIYFQDFIPQNNFDIRVIVIGDRAFALKRLVRNNDFRASGSGKIIFDRDEIDEKAVEISFLVNKQLKSQCVAFDFVFAPGEKPLIVEVSYGFAVAAYDKCPGYWDSKLNWIEGAFNPQAWMIENLINSIKNKQ